MRLRYLCVALAGVLAMTIAAPASADTTRKAKFGKRITLKGFDRTKLRVTPYRFEELVPGEFEAPKAGHRYVGVWLKLRNVGRKRIDDSPSNGAKLVTRGGKAIDATIVVDSGCAGGAGVKVPRRQTRRVCVPFEVRERARFRYFEYTMNSGFADMLGQWRRLPRP